MDSWFYVLGQDSVGPVEEVEIKNLLDSGTLTKDSYVWKKGFENWQKVGEVTELSAASQPAVPVQEFRWDTIKSEAKIFHIKIGPDRGEPEAEYGPFSLAELSKAYEEKRINAKTYIFSPGMTDWIFLADIPNYEKLFNELPPIIDELDRRQQIRKPFVAKLFFHDNQELFEGVCRDISVGGLQILVSDFPCSVGDNIVLNVHPENSGVNFSAEGVVVRILEGARGFSLRFNNLNPQAKSAIDNYVNQG